MKQKRQWTNKNQAAVEVANLWEDSPIKVGGKKGGDSSKKQKKGIHALSKEERQKNGSINGKRNAKNGIGLVARSASKKKDDAKNAGTISGNKHKGKFLKKWQRENPDLTFEQNSKIGKKQGKKNVKNGHLEKVRITGGKNASEIEYRCEHCDKIVKGAVYHRWHGDNCTEYEKITQQLSIIKMLNKKQFTSNDIVALCKKIEYNYKLIKYGILKNEEYITIVKVGTNQSNPTIFKLK